MSVTFVAKQGCEADKEGMTTFGDAVKRLRIARDLSQEELAAKAGFSRATMQNIEESAEDKLQGATRRKLAAALEITTDQLRETWKGEERSLTIPAHLMAWMESEAGETPVAEWLERHLRRCRRLMFVRKTAKDRVAEWTPKVLPSKKRSPQTPSAPTPSRSSPADTPAKQPVRRQSTEAPAGAVGG